MTSINSRATKAEILEALEAAEQELDLLRDVYYTAQPISSNQVILTFKIIRREADALLLDIKKLGAWCRNGTQPLLDNARKIVNNDRRARSRSSML